MRITLFAGSMMALGYLVFMPLRGPGEGLSANEPEQDTSEVVSLLCSLEGGDPETKRDAAKQLGKVRPTGEAIIVGLTKALKDKDKSVRTAAARALGEIGPPASSAVSALEKARDEKAICPCIIDHVLKRIMKAVFFPEQVRDA